MNPNPEKAVPQEPQASGAGYNSLAAAFGELGVTPASFPKEAANDPKNENLTNGMNHSKKTNNRNHGGNNNKASNELTELLKQTLEENKIKDRQLETELKKDEKLFDKEVERMEDVYAQFSEDLNALEKRLSEETNYRRKKRLNALKSQAMDHLRVLRRFFPKDVTGAQSEYDTEVFKEVSEKFKKYEEARRRQTIAEIDLNKKGGSIGKHEEARNEAIKLREEISSLIQQGETIVAKNIPHPAQDESIGNIRTGVAEAVNAMPPEINPEERLIIAPEGSASGSLELAQQENVAKNTDQGGMETEENARIITPVESLTEQSTTEEGAHEAISAFENEGGRVIDADLEHTAEEHNASLPVLTEVVGESPDIQREEKEKGSRPVLNAEQIVALNEKNKLTREAALAQIANAESAVDARAENAGVDKNMLHRVGETWNKFPLRYKLLLSAGMLVSGVGAAALGATVTTGAIAAIGAGIRGASGAGMFVGFEKMLKDSAEKKSGAERSKSEELRHTVLAASLSILVAGVLPGIVRDYAVEHGFFDKVRELFGGHTAHVEASASVETPVQATPEYAAIAEAGDSRWSLAERALAEGPYKDQFNAIASDEQRTYIIDAIKDKITEGMTAEQANTLNIGDNVDFKEVFSNKDFMDKAFSGAQHLSVPEIASIQNYNVETTTEAPVETAARAVSTDELLGQPLLTDFTPPEQPSVAVPSPEAGKLADSFISSNVTVPAPDEVIAPSPAVTAETVGLVSLATTATTMPQEFAPKNPQILAYIDQQFHDDVHALFGEKGILGFGRVDGMKSPHWLDFESRTFDEIKNATPTGGPDSIGVNNPEAHKKMQSYLVNVSRESKIQPEEGETIGKYIKRAMEITASRLQTKQ